MQAFVSTWTMKLDRKGRVSIPAPFRTVLIADGFEGVYTIPSTDRQAIDAGGNKFVALFESRLNALDPTSYDYDLLTTAFYGESTVLSIDSDGRVSLPERLKEQAGITSEVCFVGKGFRFQLWAPDRYEAYRQKAIKQAQTVLWGQSGPQEGA
jgi:MraZ protein